MPTVSDYLLLNQGGVSKALNGTWVQLVNNATSTAYVSTAASDANGLYTVNNVPPGSYTVKTGPTASGAWTTTGDANYMVPSTAGLWDAGAAGIICDGVTDQITQLQALVDRVGALPFTQSKRIWLPGFVAISSPLIIREATHASACHGLQIMGPGRKVSGLVQLTNSTPVIQTGGDLIHNVVIEDIGLKWANLQTTAHTNSYGIKWTATGAVNGWFDWTLRRLQIDNPYVGLGNAGTGVPSVWAQVWDDIVMTNAKHKVIDLSAAISVLSHWRKIKHLGLNSSTPTGDAVAIDLSGGNEIVCDNLDLEDWAFTRLIDIIGGSPVNFRGIHVERWTGSATGNCFNVFNTGPTIFSNVNIGGTPDASSGINLFSAASGGRLIIDGVVTSLTIANSANYKTLSADSTSQLWVRNISRQSGTVVPLLPVDATTQAVTIQDNNQFGSAIIALADIRRSRQTPTEAVLVSGVNAASGEIVQVTLTAARTVGAPLTPVTGQQLTFIFTQDGTGSRALTWNAVFKTSWQAAQTASAISSVSFEYDGTNWQQVAGAMSVDNSGRALVTASAGGAGALIINDVGGSGISTIKLAESSGGTIKWIRNQSGTLQIINTANSVILWQMSDPGVVTQVSDLVLSTAPRILTTGTIPTVGSGGAGTSALSILSGSTNTSGRFQVTLTGVAPGVVAGVVAFGGGALATAPLNVMCSLSAPTAGVASPPMVGADTYTTSGFTVRVYGPTTVTTGTYVVNYWCSF